MSQSHFRGGERFRAVPFPSHLLVVGLGDPAEFFHRSRGAPASRYGVQTLYRSNWGPQACYFNSVLTNSAVNPSTNATLMTLMEPTVLSTPTHDDLIMQAFEASRSSLQWVQGRLGLLEQAIRDADRLPAKAQVIALVALGTNFSRDIAVLSDKLRTSRDPLSSEFRYALHKALQLVRRNLYEKGSIIDEGTAGRCDPNLWGGAMPFAAATPWDPEPRVSVCAAWFPMNADLHRDVITHEFFHLVGLTDRPVIANTSDALDDANTMAQLVAYIHDRRRWEDSSGLSKPNIIYPAP